MSVHSEAGDCGQAYNGLDEKSFEAANVARSESEGECQSEESDSPWTSEKPRPWADDNNFLKTIPSSFRLDIDSMFALPEGFQENELCNSWQCEEWFKLMCRIYDKPLFSIHAIDDQSDIEFYRQSMEAYWPEWKLEDYDWLEPGEDPEEIRCRHERNHLILCLGRQRELGVAVANDRLHVRTGTNETIFTIRAVSPDDPSCENFSTSIGDIITDYYTDEAWERIQSWVHECQRDHSLCAQRDALSRKSSSKASSRPSRLLYVGTEADEIVRLVNTADLGIEELAQGYCALSYCWGPGPHSHSTTLSNLEERYIHGMDLTLLPLTIMDAITVTQYLGMRLLWVDSLCIIQNDPSDKQGEISRMDAIYEHARLLISAARAATSDAGFLFAINPHDIEDNELQNLIPFHYRYQGRTGHVLLEEWYAEKEIIDEEDAYRDTRDPAWTEQASEPVNKRAWTMQEHLLATRILAFGKTGLRWQCMCSSSYGPLEMSNLTNRIEVLARSSSMACRNPPRETDHGMVPGQAKEEEEEAGYEQQPSYLDEAEKAKTEWKELRTNYSLRGLSMVEDRLPAFSAVPKQFVPILGTAADYIAGHWRSHMPVDLLWENRDLVRDRHGDFPTWSWASAGFCTKSPQSRSLELPFGSNMDEAVSVVDVQVERRGDPFGDVSSAKLLMVGKLVPAKLVYDSTDAGWQVVHNVICDVECLIEEMPKAADAPAATIAAIRGERSDMSIDFDMELDGYYRRLEEADFLAQMSSGEYPRSAQCIHYMIEVAQSNNSVFSTSYGLIVQKRPERNQMDQRKEYFRIGTFSMKIEFWEDSQSDNNDEEEEELGGGGKEEEEEGEEGEESNEDSVHLSQNGSEWGLGGSAHKRNGEEEVVTPFAFVDEETFWLV